MKIITFNKLYSYGVEVRVHGNGFIQVDIPETNLRLHVWPRERLETQKVYTGIHNHKFGLKSKILCGKLIHTQFEGLVIADNGDWQMYKTVPRESEDTGLVLASPFYFTLTNPQTFQMCAGSEYEFPAGKFHESRGEGLTATLMQKTSVDESIEVIVLCPKDKKPDYDFHRYQFEQKVLWNIIDDVFNQIGYIEIPE